MGISTRRNPVFEAEAQGERVVRTDQFEWLARAGLLARGVVYGVIGVLAIKLALGDVFVHRLPVEFKGRVIAADGTPRSGAAITVSGLWHRLADFVDETSPSTVDGLAAVTPGAARLREGAAVQARVRQLQLMPERSALLDDALPGTQQIRVSTGVPFAPGSATAPRQAMTSRSASTAP